MIVDVQNTLGTDQVVTAAAATTDYLDLGAAREPGIGGDLTLVITCTTTTVSGGSTTVQFQLQCDDNTSFSSPKTVIETDAIAKASLVAGYQVFLPIPPGLDERYVRAYFNVATADLTAGKFTTQIVQGIQKSKAYAPASTY